MKGRSFRPFLGIDPVVQIKSLRHNIKQKKLHPESKIRRQPVPFSQMAGFLVLVTILLVIQAYSTRAQTPTVLPNIDDPNAVDAQNVCPGYKASNVKTTPTGLTATLMLAGPACNVYGTDVSSSI
jgi:hypothetical protein